MNQDMKFIEKELDNALTFGEIAGKKVKKIIIWIVKHIQILFIISGVGLVFLICGFFHGLKSNKMKNGGI